MLKLFSKILIVAAVLIAFVGQAFANTMMSCEMSAESTQSYMVMDHSSMDHSSVDHSMMGEHDMTSKSDKQNHEECCGADCACPASACTTLTIVSSALQSANLVRLSEAVVFQLANQTKSIPSSLFRPPIFA